MAKYKADPVTMQVVRYALEAVADDMGHALQRMGRSTIVKEIMDFNCAVLGREGDILAQAHLCPLMMFSLRQWFSGRLVTLLEQAGVNWD